MTKTVCSFSATTGDSLAPLSGLDDLVSHLFQGDPEKVAHHLNKLKVKKSEKNMLNEVRMSNISAHSH